MASRSRWMGALLMLSLMSWTGSANADQLLLDFSGGTAATPGAVTGSVDAATLGFSFTASLPITVGALGMWDEGGDGLARTHIIALWATNGALLAEAVLSPSSTPVASSSGFGQWVFEEIAPLVLNAGTYVVAVIYSTGDDPDLVRVSATPTLIPEVAFGTTRFLVSGEIDFPVNTLSEVVISANLLTVATAVQAPSALLMVAFTAAGLCAARAWRRRPLR